MAELRSFSRLTVRLEYAESAAHGSAGGLATGVLWPRGVCAIILLESYHGDNAAFD